jgi:3-deoxy-D-manno-octulosonic-acid transferase
MHPAAAQLAAVLAQTEADASRLESSGAREVRVIGNLKFDMTPDEALIESGREWRRAIGRPVVLGASLREGEEAPLLAAWRKLPSPRPLLVLVPRHPQRFDDVAALAAARGFAAQRRSGWQGRPPPAALDAELWIGDSIGEMPLYYSLADVALLGGSFAALGGQNLIEAAACGCPVVMGPHTFNFAAAAELAVAAGAAMRVPDIEEAVVHAVALATSPQRSEWAERAQGFAAQHRGAAERMADEVLALLQ